jgi:hypothetical protein
MSQILTARNSVIARRMVDLLEPFIGDSNFFDPPLQGVSYGDQQKIPAVPWVCVEPNDKDRPWDTITPTDMTEVVLEIYLLCYFATVDKGTQPSRETADQFGETVEEYFNVNHRQMRNADGNDLVIYSFCVKNESGYTQRQNNLYRSNRITWRGRSKLRLTQAQ